MYITLPSQRRRNGFFDLAFLLNKVISETGGLVLRLKFTQAIPESPSVQLADAFAENVLGRVDIAVKNIPA